LSSCPRRSLPSGELGAAPSTHVGCELLVVSIAALVASSGVLMLSRASARVRLASSSTARAVVVGGGDRGAHVARCRAPLLLRA
jgi:hypothetical protein